jgi:hypothetical protein
MMVLVVEFGCIMSINDKHCNEGIFMMSTSSITSKNYTKVKEK